MTIDMRTDSGIRPKLSRSGFHDFEISLAAPGFVNLLGIESPGLTSSFAIAEMVEDIVKVRSLNPSISVFRAMTACTEAGLGLGRRERQGGIRDGVARSQCMDLTLPLREN